MFAATDDGKESSSSQGPEPCHHFKLSEIRLATQNFDESLVIGRGGFGKVYKGTIVNGESIVVVAIKRLDSMSNQGATEFWAEVEMLSKLRHCHVVSLIGYCNDGKEMILVYEYMPCGTLEDHLHKLCTPLSWLQRLKICIGAARGLEYLHTGMGIEHRVIHRDVKSSNILLHESWAAKISDFGLSRIGPKDQPKTYVSTKVKGTFGYLDPNYFRTGRLTRKSDIYAFGVILFEVLCRKRAVDGSPDDEEWGLARWAQESIKEGSLRHIMDSELRDQISPKCLKDFVRIAHPCLHDDPKRRPTMTDVVFNLEGVLALQEKTNNSLEHAGKTIFGRMYDMFPFTSKGEHSAHGDSKLSSNSKGKSKSARKTVGLDNNTSLDTREVPADCTIPSPSLKVFNFADLERATRRFDRRLGPFESSQKLYLGWVDKNTFAPSSPDVGITVVVKNLGQGSLQIQTEWLAEVSFLGRLAHSNIVRLLGYCSNKQERLLVYEYMPNRSYDLFLFKNIEAPVIVEPLSWGTRLIIMIGVARGLTYLHSSKDQAIYSNVKSSNILLDQDFNPKLGDFWTARCGPETRSTDFVTRVIGTSYSEAPEYIATGKLSVKGDVYCFGVVLLETLTGLRAIDNMRPKGQHSLVYWARPFLEKKVTLKKIMDPRLEQNYPLQGAFACAALALRCLAYEPKVRPSSEEVLRNLEQIYAANE